MTIPVGLHLDIDESTYHSFEAASNSSLSKIYTASPAHLRHSLDNPNTGPRPEAFRIGSAAHHAILEPEIFDEVWGQIPDIDRRTKAGKQAWADAQEKYGDNVLRAKHYNDCLGMKESVENHSTARELLRCAGTPEVTLVWHDERTGVLCKARIDYLPVEASMGVVDLKTTINASEKAFAKSLWAYGYHRQAAHYLSGLRHLGYNRNEFRFVCVEKENVYAVQVFRIDEGSIDAGEMQINNLLDIYKTCQETGVWPAYPDVEVDLSIPPWAFSEIDREKN
jgi:hypothetical protein